MTERKTIDDLRAALFETIDAVKNGKMDVDRAKIIGDLSQVIVNSAMVEVKYSQVTGSKGSGFLEKDTGASFVHKIRG